MTIALILTTAIALQTSDKPSERPDRSLPQLSDMKGEQFRDRTEVRTRISEELQSPRYKRLRTRFKKFDWKRNRQVDNNTAGGNPGWFRRILRWLFGTGRTRATPPGGGGQSGSNLPSVGFGGVGAFWAIVWVLLGICLIIIIALVIKAAAVKNSDANKKRIRVSTEDDAIAPTTPPGEIPSDEYMHRALQLAEEGDHRRAIRQLVLGGMSWIERAGLIRFRRGLTNRDYIRAVYRRAEQRQQFAGIILDFERVFFGRRDATPENFEECLASYQNAFGQAPDAAKIAEERKRQQEAEAARRRDELRKSAPPATTMAASVARPPTRDSATATVETGQPDFFDELAGEADEWAPEPAAAKPPPREDTSFDRPPADPSQEAE